MTLLQFLKVTGLVGVTFLVGSSAFLHLIWLPALRTTGPALLQELSRALRPRLLWLAAAGAVAVILAAATDLLRIAGEFTGEALLSAQTLQFVTMVATTKVGRLLLFRMLFGALAVLALLLEQRWPRLAPWLTAAAGLALLGTFSLAGHSAASPGKIALPVLADLVHLAATVIWYGGLVCLVLLPWRRLQASDDGIHLVGRTVHRFAMMGVGTMAVLSLTGTLLAVGQLYGLAALVEHRYGETLLVKLLFLAGVLLLAGFNHFLLKPRLTREVSAAGQAIRPFRWAVAGEAALGLGVVCWAGLLSTTAPPQGEPFRVTVTITDTTMTPLDLDLPVNQPIRMTVINQGSKPNLWVAPKLPHEMEEHAHGAGMTGLLFYVEPGKSVTQTYVLRKPGRYTIDCVALGPCKPGVLTAH